ncbi:MAG: hypothetical protein HC913_03200 [Microscillaceae bacterium]|nr:hypothetical protein [Microscillaceae bacterium]
MAALESQIAQMKEEMAQANAYIEQLRHNSTRAEYRGGLSLCEQPGR